MRKSWPCLPAVVMLPVMTAVPVLLSEAALSVPLSSSVLLRRQNQEFLSSVLLVGSKPGFSCFLSVPVGQRKTPWLAPCAEPVAMYLRRRVGQTANSCPAAASARRRAQLAGAPPDACVACQVDECSSLRRLQRRNERLGLFG